MNSFIAKMAFEKLFPSMFRSIVVLSNPKTILNAKYAKKEVKEKVIRADQLIEYIKKANAESGFDSSNEVFDLRAEKLSVEDYIALTQMIAQNGQQG